MWNSIIIQEFHQNDSNLVFIVLQINKISWTCDSLSAICYIQRVIIFNKNVFKNETVNIFTLYTARSSVWCLFFFGWRFRHIYETIYTRIISSRQSEEKFLNRKWEKSLISLEFRSRGRDRCVCVYFLCTVARKRNCFVVVAHKDSPFLGNYIHDVK